jgi:dTDP-4-amino-4,6-dideoxygalactose transaminase
MAFRIGRTLPPAAAPIQIGDILNGVVGIFQGDKALKKFEEELKDYFKIGHCYTVSSGKAALTVILQALHELSPDRDEVLIPAYTCYSVPSAIVRAGLKVRLCDLGPGTLDFDFGRIEEELENPRLLAVVPTHLFGMPTDMERVKELARKNGVWVIEDAAQAFGAIWRCNNLGTLGDVGLFSMGRGKAFSTVEGGVIITANELVGKAVGRRISSLPGYGATDCLKLIIYALALGILVIPWIYWLPKSLPFLKLGETVFDPEFPIKRFSSFQAGLAKGWNERIEAMREARRKNAGIIAEYRIKPLGAINGRLPDLIRFPVLCKDAEAKGRILDESNRLGLGIADGYPDSIDGIREMGLESRGKGFPVAKNVAKRLITLPIHPFVTNDDQQRIVKTVKKNLL